MKIFVTIGVNTVSKKIKQLHLQNTLKPLDLCTSINEDYDEVVGSYLFIE